MRNRPLCIVSLVLFVIMCVGIHGGGEKFLKELKPSPVELMVPEDAEIQVVGQVYQKEVRENYQILYLKNNSIHYQKHSLNESRIIVYDETKENIKIGNKAAVRGSLSFYQKARNPGNFDQKLYYQRQNIHGSVWALQVKIQDGKINRWKNSLYEFRQQWKEGLIQALGEKDGRVLSAILLGEKAGIDEEIKQLYQVNGIGHILAISGLHLSFIGIGMYQLLRKVCGSYVAGGTAGIVFLLLYIAMIGMTVSVFRALVMFLFRIGADMTGRHYDSLTALAVSAAAVVLWRPLYIYDGGFWLSFGAVFAVSVILPLFQKLPIQGFWASLSINMMTLPLILYYFYEFPVYSIILNLFVIPLMSVLLFLGIAGSLFLGVVPVCGNVVLKLCKLIFWIYEKSCMVGVQLPGARVVAGKPELWEMIVYYVCLFLVLIWIRFKNNEKKENRKRKRRAAGMIILGMLIMLTGFPESNKVEVTVLDVGQGDCIFVKGPKGGTYLTDGGSSDIKKAGQYRIEPFLKSKGVGVVDYVFVSHGDSDHINGIEEMLVRQNVGVKIKTLVLPERCFWDESLEGLAETAMENGSGVMIIKQGEMVKEGTLSITCISPQQKKNIEAGNMASMVLAVQYGEFDMLLTGDVEEVGEDVLKDILKEKNTYRNFEVLKVAHHGSKNSTKKEFLEVVQPLCSVISAGEGNRYGHPHEETVERLLETGSRIYCTKETGAVIFGVTKSGVSVEKYLE